MRRAPSLIILGLVVVLACAGGVFAYDSAAATRSPRVSGSATPTSAA
jgi:hypothetical protein